MEQKINWKQKADREIHVSDLCKKILKSWKFILICTFVGAGFFGGYKYYKDLKTMNTEGLPEDERRFSDEEYEAIESAQNLQGDLDKQNEYFTESILMNLNAYQENRVVLLYEVSSEDGNKTIEAMERCMFHLENGGVVEDILNTHDWDISGQYIQELICAEPEAVFDASSNNLKRYFSASIIGDTIEMAGQLAAQVDQSVKAYANTIPEVQLLLLESKNNEVCDSELVEKKDTLFAHRDTQINNLNTLISQFSEEQRIVYYGSNDGEAVSGNGEIDGPHLSIQYIMAGAIIGFFLGCGWIMCRFLLSDKIKSVGEIEENCDLTVFGSLKICKNDEISLKEKNRIIAELSMRCQKRKLKNIAFFLDNKIESTIRGAIEPIQKEMGEHGIAVTIEEDLLEEGKIWERIGKTDAVVVMAEIEKTSLSLLEKELNFFARNEVLVLGIIAIAE